MHHYIYCIENLVNGKVYVGKHSTDDMDDGYMGSGKLLNAAIKKHGIESFRKHVLATFESSEVAFEIERQLVNEEFIVDDNTYNLAEGGNGGYREAARLAVIQFLKDPVQRAKHSARMSLQTKRLLKEGKIRPPDWTGRRHTNVTKKKIGEANSRRQRGSGNSQFGTVWIHHPMQQSCMKIKSDELSSYLEQGWVKDRKMKW